MSGRTRLRALRPRPKIQVKSQLANILHLDANLKPKEEGEEEDPSEMNWEEASSNDKFKESSPLANDRFTSSGRFDMSDSAHIYECKLCKPAKSFSNFKPYVEHLKKEHKQKGKLNRDTSGNRCSMCKYVALNMLDLETHQRVHHLKRTFFRCGKCPYGTYVRARYTKHVKYHSMPMIKCNECDFRTPYKWNLDRHTRNHGGGGAFQCGACNFTADIRQSLTVHETNHHEPPVGQASRKGSIPFERRPRSSAKRYNQVGASDFRESEALLGSTTISISPDNEEFYVSDSLHSVDDADKSNEIIGAECIALKCEEKGCQFITAWDSEMQRHLAESHSLSLANKSKKPLPMLIPLSPVPTVSNSSSANASPTTLLKVPRVRVRPELAQIARDTEIAKLYGNKEGSSSKKEASAADLFEKKNALFFDKLKEKLTSSASLSNGLPEVAVEGGSTHPIGRRVFKCPHCPFWASTASRFHVHIVGHLNRKPFECSLCAYRSNWRWDITKHIKLKAVKDPVHLTARVLMTDETGRRNYSKYNKYLAKVEQSWEGQNVEERSYEGTITDESPLKLLALESNDFLQAPELTPAPISVFTEETQNANVSLRPPPPLKAAIRNRGQSLLKNSPSSSINSPPSLLATNSVEEGKRTLWKCKKCNYRNSSKLTVLEHVKSHYERTNNSAEGKPTSFNCGDCPYSAPDAASLSLHKVHHRPNLEAIFKCYLCPYYVSTKAELLEHARLHGEELAVVHQQNIDNQLSVSKYKATNNKNVKDREKEKGEEKSSKALNNSSKVQEMSGPLLLDTRALPDAPLVWVSRPDGTMNKMLKCRHCPFVSSRRAEVHDHETMHVESSNQRSAIACSDCSFSCSRKDVMDAHTDMHSGSLGTVHCLVDESRTDSAQLNDLTTLLGLSRTPKMGSEPDLKDTRLVHCCNKCPARFLCEKELRIHLRYHSTELAYSCQWCSYAARQSTHLLAHQKAHSMEYQERTKYLVSLYSCSQRFPLPTTACVESNQEANGTSTRNVAWIVVEVPDTKSNSSTAISGPRAGNQIFTCAKCPARYVKLDALEYHMTLHGANNRYKCTECDYSSETARNLVTHQVAHRRHNETVVPPRPLPPPDPQFGVFMRGNPNFVYPGYLRNGRLKEKRYKCHKCPSAFEKREQYRVHLTLHGAKQRYRCDTCDYSVKYYANYIQHLKKHQANAAAQASRRQFEEDSMPWDQETIQEVATSSGRSGKSLKSSTSSAGVVNNYGVQVSNQDKQSMMLMQKKGAAALIDEEVGSLRCQNCPFSTSDKDLMDAHRRRHGIERMTPSCPHCDYIPKKDENVGDHIKLHFKRLYKPESYLIIELLTLTMKRIAENDKQEKKPEILFRECADGRFLPVEDLSSGISNSTNSLQERLIVDPMTGETKNRVTI
ncbi:zinc finger protein 91-like isoform X2 [Prorops nasuta]|uniref:zinc finger protein 91-like isoform X2 n=1 Tax=Prorops nasuta TaxID=863751 RepID=UPI0034CF3199